MPFPDPDIEPFGPTLGRAIRAAGRVSRKVAETLDLPGLGRESPPGAQPGIEHLPEIHEPPGEGAVTIRCIDYSAEQVKSYEVGDLDTFLAETRPAWVKIRWVNVEGLHPFVVKNFRETYQIHTLAAEDTLHVPQRPKAETYDGHLFLVTRMLSLQGEKVISEQVSIFLGSDWVLTFQEGRRGDVWDNIRERLGTGGSRLRTSSADFLVYALLDAIVDHVFPILEHYTEALENLEGQVIRQPTPDVLREVQALRRELLALRRVIWPTREMIEGLRRAECSFLTPTTLTYLRDVHDHTVQIMDLIENFREMSGVLTDLYMSAVSHRMNEVMKVLTIISTIFIPITFLAGVYGMNFRYFPELEVRWAYPAFWAVCFIVMGGLLFFFRRLGWLGRQDRLPPEDE